MDEALQILTAFHAGILILGLLGLWAGRRWPRAVSVVIVLVVVGGFGLIWYGAYAAQNEYHLLNRGIESEVTPACREYEIGIVASRPLAHGFLTGKYRRGQPPPAGTRLAVREITKAEMDFELIDALQDFARQRGVALLDVAFGYVLHNRAVVSVIAGATSIEQLQANAAAIHWKPTTEDLEALGEILTMPFSAPTEGTRTQ